MSFLNSNPEPLNYHEIPCKVGLIEISYNNFTSLSFPAKEAAVKISSILYYVIAVVLIFYMMTVALPFLRNLAPGLLLFYALFPVLFLMLSHYSPREIFRAFQLAGRKSTGTQEEYKNSRLLFTTAQNMFIGIMLLGLVVLLVWFLASGPQNRQIAHPVSIMVMFIFWPLMFILLLCLPFRSALTKHINRLDHSVPENNSGLQK
jgi:cell shape-determining protein MreD